MSVINSSKIYDYDSTQFIFPGWSFQYGTYEFVVPNISFTVRKQNGSLTVSPSEFLTKINTPGGGSHQITFRFFPTGTFDNQIISEQMFSQVGSNEVYSLYLNYSTNGMIYSSGGHWRIKPPRFNMLYNSTHIHYVDYLIDGKIDNYIGFAI